MNLYFFSYFFHDDYSAFTVLFAPDAMKVNYCSLNDSN